MRRWRTLAIPLVQLPPHPEPDVQRMAEMVESLGYSVVLQYGYGKGEALLFAYQHDPKLLRPFIERASGFTLEQLGGDPDAPEVEAAVRARNELMTAVRETVAAHPKELRDSTRP